MASEGVAKSMDPLSAEQRFALELDEEAVRVARSRCPLDLAIGETLLRLFEGDRLCELGYAKQTDYAKERLGIPPRTMYEMTRLARSVRDRPLLGRAVLAGRVTPPKALAIADVAEGEAEAAWTAKAMTTSLRELKALAREHGAAPPEEFEAECLWLRMTPEQQDRLDAALALAGESLGPGAPVWQRLEAVCQEWIGDHAEYVPEDGAKPPQPPESPEGVPAEAVARHLDAVEEAISVTTRVDAEDASSNHPRALDARARRLLAARAGYDEAFGIVAERVVRHRIWRTLGYRSFEEYCSERLGTCAKAVRQRAWLERKMFALPEVREALRSGKLTYSKALLVANGATDANVAERIEDAASTTWQQTERGNAEREAQRSRETGVRRLWGPKDAALVFTDAIVGAQAYYAARGEEIDAGEALARIADHVREVWTAHSRKRRNRAREEVLTRHGGLCAAPGCSRPAQHEHHITYRAHGGGNETWNRLGLCAVHHLRCLHRGRLRVSGRAGDLLVWRFGGEVWITRGDDDVRRAV